MRILLYVSNFLNETNRLNGVFCPGPDTPAILRSPGKGIALPDDAECSGMATGGEDAFFPAGGHRPDVYHRRGDFRRKGRCMYSRNGQRL